MYTTMENKRHAELPYRLSVNRKHLHKLCDGVLQVIGKVGIDKGGVGEVERHPGFSNYTTCTTEQQHHQSHALVRENEAKVIQDNNFAVTVIAAMPIRYRVLKARNETTQTGAPNIHVCE